MTLKRSPRHLQRIVVAQAIFMHEMGDKKSDPKKILEYTLGEFEGKITDSSFAFELLEGILSHQKEINGKIEEFAPKWPISKIAPIDRALLEIGVYEILYSKDVPPVVAIDEAIEIAKAYGDENSFKFVNGVLSAVMKAAKKNVIARP